jgi:hypothetical protein
MAAILWQRTFGGRRVGYRPGAKSAIKNHGMQGYEKSSKRNN